MIIGINIKFKQGVIVTLENIKKECTRWIREVFKLSDTADIQIEEIADEHSEEYPKITKIILIVEKNEQVEYFVRGPLSDITKRDIKKLYRKVTIEKGKLHPVLGPIFRFIAWWIAFTGIYSMFAVCPFCGQAGCAVGAGSAGVIGGFFAFLVQYGSAAFGFIKKGIAGLCSKKTA